MTSTVTSPSMRSASSSRVSSAFWPESVLVMRMARKDMVFSSSKSFDEADGLALRPLPMISSFHMTIRPRMNVPMGQPVTVRPSWGVHLQRLSIQSLVMVRLAFMSTMVKSAS